MAVDDVFKVAVLGSFGNGHPWVMTHHYIQQAAETYDTAAEDLANEFLLGPATVLAQIMSVNDTIDTIEVRQVIGGLEGYDLPANLPGEESGDGLPPQVCPLVKWSTGYVGRRNRGRSYFPAGVETSQIAGELTVTFKGAVQNVANDHLEVGGGTPAKWQKVVYGKANPEADPPLTEHVAIITSAIVRTTLATQQRRKAV